MLAILVARQPSSSHVVIKTQNGRLDQTNNSPKIIAVLMKLLKDFQYIAYYP